MSYAYGPHENVIAAPQFGRNWGAPCEGQAQGLDTKGAMPMITLKSCAHGRKPETTVIGETKGYVIDCHGNRCICALAKPIHGV